MHRNLVALAVIVVACAFFFRQRPTSEGWSLTISTRPTAGSLPAQRFTVFSDGRFLRRAANLHSESFVYQAEALAALEAALRSPELGRVSSTDSEEIWEIQMDGTTRRVAAQANSPAFQKARAAFQAAAMPPVSGPAWLMSLTQRQHQGPWESRVFQVSYTGWANVTYNRANGATWSTNVARISPPKLEALYGRFQIHPLDGLAPRPNAAYSLALMADRKHFVMDSSTGHFSGPAGQTLALLESCFPQSGRLLEQPWLQEPLAW